MDKIKLIRSFADYPVGEYESDGNCYYLNDAYNTFIHKDIVERFKDHFEEVKERPTSWEDIELIGNKMLGYWVTDDCSVQEKYGYGRDKKVFKTEEQAEASIALAQITQLLVAYDIPEENIKRYTSEGFVYDGCSNKKRKGLLRFDTKEKKDHFYKHHKTLIDKLAPFYIF